MTTTSLQFTPLISPEPQPRPFQRHHLRNRWSYGRSYCVLGAIIPLVLVSLLWLLIHQQMAQIARKIPMWSSIAKA